MPTRPAEPGARALTPALAAVFAALLLGMIPGTGRAMCAMTQYSASLRTPTDSPLPPELPLLLLVTAGRGGATVNTSDGAAVPVPLRVTGAAGVTQALVAERVGPGLIAYQADPPLAPGEYTLEGLVDPIALTVAAVTLPALAAPDVTSIVHNEVVIEGREGGRRWTDRIALGAPVGPNAVALVFAADGSQTQLDLDPTGVAARATQLEVRGGTGGRCGSTRPPGDYRLASVRVRPSVVDQWGRVAVASADVTVTQEGALATSRAETATGHSARCAAAVAATSGGTSAGWALLALSAAGLVARRRARA